MINYTDFLRGSEWRKWDLHVHTPISYENKYSGWDSYVKGLKEKAVTHDIEMVGINDYFSVDGYEKLLAECDKESKKTNPRIKLNNNKFLYLIPVVELRLENFTMTNESVNIHVIFSTDILPSTIRSSFLEKLTIRYRSYTCLNCKDEDLIKIGYAEKNSVGFDANMDLSSLHDSEKRSFIHKALKFISFSSSIFEEGINKFQKILKESGIKDDKYLIVISNKGRGGLDALHWHDKFNDLSRTGNIRQNLLNLVDVCFTNSENDIQFLLGQKDDTPKEEILNRFRSLKPCIWGSDAHEEKNLFHPSNGNTNDYTWIKADPTFKGLKQIVYEPKDRVKIQSFKPNIKNDRYIISKLKFVDSTNKLFGDQQILLNENLNAIIGGKSSGKTLLMYSAARSIDPDQVDRTAKRLGFEGYKFDTTYDFQVTWNNGEKDTLNPNSDIDTKNTVVICYSQHELNYLKGCGNFQPVLCRQGRYSMANEVGWGAGFSPQDVPISYSPLLKFVFGMAFLL